MKLLIIALISIVAVASAAEQPPDLTGTDAKIFKAHLGQVVSFRGKLVEGMQGECLSGATPKGVYFYIMGALIKPDNKPYYTTPPKWERLFGHQVSVRGVLKFISFDRSHAKPGEQIPPDYYYMDYKDMEFCRLDSQ